MMIKKEIAKQCGFELDQSEIEVLCYIWTNTPKAACDPLETYVDLGVPPSDDCDSPFTRITIAIDLAAKGLLQQHQENVNSFRLTEAGEKLHAAFYQ